MWKLIRFIGLVSQSIFLQFIHFWGLAAFLAAGGLGYYRVKSWSVPILAVVFGVAVDKFADVADVTGILEKAERANERGGFLVVVYFAIVAVGYIAGAYARHQMDKRAVPTAPPAVPKKK